MYVATYLSQKSIGNPRSIPGSQALSDTLFLFLFFLFLGLRVELLVPFLQTLNSCPNDSSSSPPAPFHIVRISNQENHSCDCRSKPDTSLLPVLSSLQPPPPLPEDINAPPRLLCALPPLPSQRLDPPSQANPIAPRSLDRCGREDCWGGERVERFSEFGGLRF